VVFRLTMETLEFPSSRVHHYRGSGGNRRLRNPTYPRLTSEVAGPAMLASCSPYFRLLKTNLSLRSPRGPVK
jgi:hypothetical protein